MGSSSVIPPPPPGFSLIPPMGGSVPPPPPGFTLIGTPPPAPTAAALGPSAAPETGYFGAGGAGWGASAPRREGALKSLLGMLTGVYDLANKGPDDFFPPQASQGPMTARQLLQADPSNPSAPNITPTPEEQGGYTAGNIAAFLAPTPAGKGALLTRLLAAAQTGLLTNLQGGTGGETAESAAIAGLLPPAIDKGADILKGTATTLYERALGASRDVMKEKAARIAPELVERGVTGSLRSLQGQGAAAASQVGQQLEQTYSAATQAGMTLSTAPALSALSKVKDRFITTSARAQGPTRIVKNAEAVARVEKLEDILNEIGPQGTPTQLWEFRRDLDEIIGPAGHGTTLPTFRKEEIAKAARRGLQQELDTVDSLVRPANREYGLQKDLSDVTRATIKRRTSQELPLASILAGMAGAGGSFARGGDLTDSAVQGALWAGAARGAKAPIVRTNAAVGLSRGADALIAGQDPIARLLAALFGGAATSQSQPPTPPR